MARIRELIIECGFCATRHHSKAFADTEALESALAAGYTAKCPKCGKNVLCNKVNMTWSVEESGPAGAIEFK
jgi:hypothetical protein